MFHRARTLNAAMKALQRTVDTVPEGSTEYFPSVSEVKATLRQHYNETNITANVKKHTGTTSPDVVATHLLDYVGRLFQQNGKYHIGSWFIAASDSFNG